MQHHCNQLGQLHAPPLKKGLALSPPVGRGQTRRLSCGFIRNCYRRAPVAYTCTHGSNAAKLRFLSRNWRAREGEREGEWEECVSWWPVLRAAATPAYWCSQSFALFCHCHLLLTPGCLAAIAGFATSALLSVELKTSPYCSARTSS